jgi:hypothetical protein
MRSCALVLSILLAGCLSSGQRMARDYDGASRKYENGDVKAAVELLQPYSQRRNYAVSMLLAHAWVASDVTKLDKRRALSAATLLAAVETQDIRNGSFIDLLAGKAEDAKAVLRNLCPGRPNEAALEDCFYQKAKTAIDGLMFDADLSPRVSYESIYLLSSFGYSVKADEYFDAEKLFSLGHLKPGEVLALRNSMIDSNRYSKRVSDAFCDVARGQEFKQTVSSSDFPECEKRN